MLGKWRHPENKDIEFEVTPEVVKQVAANFNRGIPMESPIVLTHSDNPKDKVGMSRAYIPTDKGLDVVFSVSDEVMNGKIEKEDTAPGVSCWLDLNYRDKTTGKEVGAVVKHVALVNHPYIEGMKGFEAVTLSEDGKKEKYLPLILSEDNLNLEVTMPELTKESAIAFLKEKEKIDVQQLVTSDEELKTLHDRIDKGELIAKEDASPVLSEELSKKVLEHVALGEDDKKNPFAVIEKLIAKLSELLKGSGDTAAQLKTVQEKMSEMEADKEVGTLLKEGKIFPAEKDFVKGLYKTNMKLFEDLKKVRTKPVVPLSELGVTVDENAEDQKKKDTKAEIDRQVAEAEKQGIRVKK